ncbi:hypothetical protein RYX36_003446 [Vicia faba]
MHLEIIHEFYANALPMEGSPFTFKTWVREKEIDFSMSAINKFLEKPWTLGNDEIDGYRLQLEKGNWDFEKLRGKFCIPRHTYELNASGKPLKFNRKSLTTEAQVLRSVVLYNIRLQSHTLFILVETAGLSSNMQDEEPIDIAWGHIK